MNQFRQNRVFEYEFNLEKRSLWLLLHWGKALVLHILQVVITMLKSRKQCSSNWNSKIGLQVCSFTRHFLLCWPNWVRPPLDAGGNCYILHLLQVAIVTLKSQKQCWSEENNRSGSQLCSLTSLVSMDQLRQGWAFEYEFILEKGSFWLLLHLG